MRRSVAFILMFALFDHGNAARILATVFSLSHSHHMTFRPMWHELSKRGHDLTLITTDPEENVSFRQIDTSFSYKIMEEITMDISNQDKPKIGMAFRYWSGLHSVCDYQFSHPEVQALIRNQSEHFDLVMTEVIFPSHMAFVDRFKTPFIGLVSIDAPTTIHRAVGNPTHPILYPDALLPYNNNLTFLQRVVSFTVNIICYIFTNYYLYPQEDETVKKYFGNSIRPLIEIEKDMDLLFINVNPIFPQIRPLGPNTIAYGGGSVLKELKPLPKDIQNYLDTSENGVIYFSLGTNVKTSSLSVQLKNIILQTLSELPYNVLWKYEDDNIKVPKNVKILKWIPQQDVLRHPNIKLFITQCGLNSIQEAIASYIPIVGIPFLGDQRRNAKIVIEKGIGLTVNRETLTKEEFKSKIVEVINNPSFKNKVIELGEVMNDVQETGLEKTMWWTEYILRHKGAKHLRSEGVDAPFYIYFMLDVIGFVLLVTAVVICISVKVTKFLFRLYKAKKE